MIRLLAYTGLRRSEPVMLRWSDVDSEAGLVMFRHGKGGKERVAAIVDSSDGTEIALQRLCKSQPEGKPIPICLNHTGARDQVAC